MPAEAGRAILLVDERQLGQQMVFWKLQLVAGDEKCMRILLSSLELEEP